MILKTNGILRTLRVIGVGCMLLLCCGCMSTGLRDERSRAGEPYLPYAGTAAAGKFATAPLWPDIRHDLWGDASESRTERVQNALVVTPLLMTAFALDLPGTCVADTVGLPFDVAALLEKRQARDEAK